MSNLQYWTACLLDGAANGSIYGLLALSLVLTYRSNKLFNFSQTSVATFIMILAVGFLGKFPTPLVVAGVLVAGFTVGVLLHFCVMRFLTENREGSHMSQTLAIFGLITIFDGLSAFTFGDTPSPFPFFFPEGGLNINGFQLSYNSLGIIATALVLIGVVWVFFRFTQVGLLMEAVAENATAARLRGVRASNVLMWSWGITGLMVIVTTLLIAPVIFVSPGMFAAAYSYSLIAVVIGGLESPLGAYLGGVMIGVVENIAGNIPWLGSNLKFSIVFLLLIIILIVMPRGIWGRADVRRV